MILRTTAALVSLAILASTASKAAEPVCPSGTLLEPYQNICAAINDVRDEFIPPTAGPQKTEGASAQILQDASSNLPVDAPPPGTGFIGIRYLAGNYRVTTSAHLHTKMFVYPDGLGVTGLPNWIYTPATNRVDQSTEVVGMYRSWSDGKGLLGLFARPCSVDYPCPNGATSNSWQFYRYLDELTCNITNEVDSGGHTHLLMHYAHNSDRLDDADPALWQNAVYLWNYCQSEWDLIWEHTYRQNKNDCSALDCSWWAPQFEVFGTDMYPPIPELGYEQSLFIYDGVRSEFRPADGAGYVDPTAFPTLVPWFTLHLDANRGFGAGNFATNDTPPTIEGQVDLSTEEDTPFELSIDDLTISDLDVDPAYQVEFEINVLAGNNYTVDDSTIEPDSDYFGTLFVPVTVSDGYADSSQFNVQLEVTPVNDPPMVLGQNDVSVVEGHSLEISLTDVVVSDVDNNLSDLVLAVQNGQDFDRNGNVITPLAGVTGDISVPIIVSDGVESSPEFNLVVTVIPDTVAPVITLLGDPSVAQFVGENYVDAGATASDDVDGDISDRISVASDVNTSLPGTYLVTFNVSDLAGNEAASVQRTVEVAVRPDTVAPVITLLGEPTVTLFVGDTYIDAGATALDDVDGDISGQIDVTSSVNVNVAGTYTVTYRVSDLAGNEATPVQRTVIVQARTTPPPTPPSSDGGACFIATAAYGSYLDPHVMVLRRFRDRFLLTNRPGRRFVELYYRYSPPIANTIARHETLKIATRVVLTPIVFGFEYPGFALALLSLTFVTTAHARSVRKHRKTA